MPPPLSTDYRPCRLRLADLSRLWRLDQRCFPPGIAYSREEIAAILRSRSDSFHWALEWMPRPADRDSGAEGGGREATLAGFLLSARTAGRGHIITLDVAPEHRRRGLGEALLRAAERHFSNLRLLGMRLEVAVNNLPALRFYARQGYGVVRTLPGYYAHDLDGLLLHKNWPGMS